MNYSVSTERLLWIAQTAVAADNELAQVQKDTVFSASLSFGHQNVWLICSAACSFLFYIKIGSLTLVAVSESWTPLLRQLTREHCPELSLLPCISEPHNIQDVPKVPLPPSKTIILWCVSYFILRKRLHELGVPVTTFRNHMTKHVGLKAYRP
jgi:hypothetical protein